MPVRPFIKLLVLSGLLIQILAEKHHHSGKNRRKPIALSTNEVLKPRHPDVGPRTDHTFKQVWGKGFENPVKVIKEDTCDQNTLNYIKRHASKVKCTARDTIVAVVSENGDLLDEVMVKRCMGKTKAPFACLPSNFSEETHHFREFDAKKRGLVCKTVKILSHHSCRPQCPKKACLPNQYLDKKTCQCICNRRACPGTHIFNQKTCECNCKNKSTTICTTSTEFDERLCKCVKKGRFKRKPLK